MRTLVALYMGFLGKPPSYGARYYVNAALRPSEEHVSEAYHLLPTERSAQANMTARGASPWLA